MASHDSAVKKNRQDIKRRLRNRQHVSRLRTEVKRFRTAVASGDVAAAEGLLRPTLSVVDRTAKLGVIKKATASRTKSRLATALNKLKANA